MNDTLSVSEIAARVARRERPGDEARLTRQIRHWTMTGVLAPIGEAFTGTGRHRRYSEETVYVVAVLAEIAGLGVSITGLKAASDRLYQNVNSPLWRTAKKGDREVHLLDCYELSGNKTWRPGLVAHASVYLFTVDDCAELFGDEQIPICGIHINLTGLFSRIRK